MLLVCIFCIGLINWCVGQTDSWQQVQQRGSGQITVLHFPAEPFVIIGDSGKLSGIEVELIKALVKYIKERYGYNITINYAPPGKFPDFYNKIKTGQNGIFGTSSLSITEKRKAEVQFSPPYIPDIEVLISSRNLPNAENEAEIISWLSKVKFLTVANTSFDENLQQIAKRGPVRIEAVENSEVLRQRISKEADLLGYCELPAYLLAFKKGVRLRRQFPFKVERQGYAFIYPKNSDWKAPIEAFFASDSFPKIIERILHNYLGEDIHELIHSVAGSDTSTGSSREIRLLTKEREFQNLELQRQQLEINYQTTLQRVAWGGVVIALLFGIILYVRFRDKQRANIVLSNKNAEIQAQQKALSHALEELQAAQHQIIASEKQAALGKLVANIAHELNTPVGAIRASVNNLLETLPQVLEKLPQVITAIPNDLRISYNQFVQQLITNEHAFINNKQERSYRKELTQILTAAQIPEPEEKARLLIQAGWFQQPITNYVGLIAQFPAAFESACQLGTLRLNLGNIDLAAEKSRKIVMALKSFTSDVKSGQAAPVEIISSLQKALRTYSSYIGNHIKVITHFPPPPGPSVYADKEALIQVWTHLIFNAIQALNESGDTLEIEISAHGNQDQVCVAIRDNGPGIVPAVQAQLFQPFLPPAPKAKAAA